MPWLRSKLMSISPVIYFVAIQTTELAIWAVTADAVAAAIGVISLAVAVGIWRVSPSIAKFISDVTPPVLRFVSGLKKIEAEHAETMVKVNANTQDISRLRIAASAANEEATEARHRAELVAIDAAHAKADAAHAKEEAAQAKLDAEAMRAENMRLRDHLHLLISKQSGIQGHVTGLGEAVLIQAGDMHDPVKDKDPAP